MLNFFRKIALICTMISLIFTFKIAPSKSIAIRRFYAKVLLRCIGCKLDQIGSFDPKANMLILNHQSMLDIILLESIYPGNLAWIAKIELERLPFFGDLITKSKMISLDRNNPRDIVRVIAEAKEKLDEGRILAIFPEGTRGEGKKLLEFKSGVKLIAKKLKLNIQPILIKNSSYILDKRLNIRPSILTFKTFPLVDMKDDAWLENTKELMQESLDELNKSS